MSAKKMENMGTGAESYSIRSCSTNSAEIRVSVAAERKTIVVACLKKGTHKFPDARFSSLTADKPKRYFSREKLTGKNCSTGMPGMCLFEEMDGINYPMHKKSTLLKGPVKSMFKGIFSEAEIKTG